MKKLSKGRIKCNEQYIFLFLGGLVDICTSVVFRLFSSLPVSFLYPFYIVCKG